MNKNNDNSVQQVRELCLTEKLVIVDGQPGCGKTLFSPIVATLKNVEMMSYAFPIEWICKTYELGNLNLHTATTLVRMFVDQHMYQSMMGRETNFRISDLSSVWKAPNSWKYIKRIFQAGDRAVPGKILREKPILNFTTHFLMASAEPIFKAFRDKVVIIEVVRHPLYMVIQNMINHKNIGTEKGQTRYFRVYIFSKVKK